MRRVYFDYNATTPVDRKVLDAMLPFFTEGYGNASSIHSAGQNARAAVESARASVAALIGAKPSEIVFTSGGTEADNLAVLGFVAAMRREKRHVICSPIEHHAVLNAVEALEKQGVEVTWLPVSSDGIVDPEDVGRALRPETVLITVMHANNELGTIQPIAEIGRIAFESNVYFHSDAVQSAGKIPIDVNELKVDLLAISAHKVYGPKGMGALYVREDTPLEPLFFGGTHERDRRPGTENVPGIAGFGKAAEIARAHLTSDVARIAALRDRFEEGILARVPESHVNGGRARRVANTANITFPHAAGESLVIAFDLQGVQCSGGAACSSGAILPSHVLRAIGLPRDEAKSTLRFSLGRFTTSEDVDYALEAIPAVVERLRQLSPNYRNAVPAG
ncbi:MAG TPA: cysteine desulfurase family protein [Candidatus Limnocylindrales bacterium]|nr:cysteine desulfurase family protein [Candidatus Limnocylindrales bacterium]